MAWIKYCADRIFDGENFLPPATVLVLDEEGKVLGFEPGTEAADDVQHLSGILLPGMINAHCHLELSHFKNSIAPGGGLVNFLLSVVQKRKEPRDMDFVQQCIADAHQEMERNGIVAVGDICNTTDALAQKQKSKLQWNNFVEVLNFSDATLEPRMQHNQQVLDAHLSAGLQQSVLTPHAPYSVSPATFRALNRATAGRLISIHYAETAAEDELLRRGTGDMLQLYALTGTAPPAPTHRSSIQSWLSFFTEGQTILLVHNTFTNAEDLHFAQQHAQRHGLNLVYCLCPNANRYIEERLPPLPLLEQTGATLVLGTDSYSSNWQLNIAAEIKLLADHFPEVPLALLLQAATRNGADAFGWHHLGRFTPGARPGLALLHTDVEGKLTGTSELL